MAPILLLTWCIKKADGKNNSSEGHESLLAACVLPFLVFRSSGNLDTPKSGYHILKELLWLLGPMSLIFWYLDPLGHSAIYGLRARPGRSLLESKRQELQEQDLLLLL